MQRWHATEAALDAHPSPQIEAEREQQRAEARAGDQALFRWLWRLADDRARAELEQRGRFLLFVQQHIVTLDHHRNRLAPLLGEQPAELDELHDALAALHRDLALLLDAAEQLQLPELRNLDESTCARAYLLSEPLVEPCEGEQDLREWLSRFMPQVAAVHERLRTLHYKNLGRLLSLRESIEQRSTAG